MKFNVVEAPSVRSRVLNKDSWTSENTNGSKHVDDNKSSSEDEVSIQKNPLITRSLLKICSKEISMNHMYSLEARWLTWYIVVGTLHDVAEDM